MRSKLIAVLMLILGRLSAQTVAVIQSAPATQPALGQPLVATLTTAPVSQHMLFVLISYGVYGDYDFMPPDASWTCTIGGRANPAAPGVRISWCSHVVVPGDGTSYTFLPTGSDAGGPGGALIFETSGTVSSQVAFSYIGSASSTLTTPSLTATAVNALPIAFSSAGGTPSSGWTVFPSSSVETGPLAVNTTTPIQATINGYNYGSSLQMLALLTPGTFAVAPVASPLAGSYAATQTVNLSTSTAGGVAHYTTDATVPTCSSTAYTSPLTLEATTQLNTITCASGYTSSAVVYGNYIIGGGLLKGISLGPNAPLNGYTLWATDALHQSIAGLSVDAQSAGIITDLKTLTSGVSADFGPSSGIPYNVVDSTVQAKSQWFFFGDPVSYAAQNDYAAAPIPANIQIEQDPGSCIITGDNHANVIDRATGFVQEWWRFAKSCVGSYGSQYAANNAAIFDLSLSTTQTRPYTYTGASAGGLSIVEGLVRYDEVAAGTVNHAIRVTAGKALGISITGSNYGFFIPPASHSSPNAVYNAGANQWPIYGDRFRLKASYNITGLSPQAKVIAQAMKTYGLIMDDLSSSQYTGQFQGPPNPLWNSTDLAGLNIPWDNFEVVTRTPQAPYYGFGSHYPCAVNTSGCTGAVGTGTPAIITSFAPVSSVITSGGCTSLHLVTANAATSYIDKVGPVHGDPTVCPTATTTYTATTMNQFLVGDDGSGDGSRATATAIVSVLPAILSGPQGMAGWQGYRPQ